MAPFHCSKVAAATLLSFAGLSAQIPAKVNPGALTLPANTPPVFKLPVKPQVNPHPTRLTDAQYAALRPQLASLLRQPEGSLAQKFVKAANLWTVGSMVNVVLGQTPPAGFKWWAFNALVTLPGVSVSNKVNSGVHFMAENVAPGTYLMTVYLDADVATIQGSVCDTAFTASVQNHMINVPYVKSTPATTALDIVCVFPVSNTMYYNYYSCDFMRVR